MQTSGGWESPDATAWTVSASTEIVYETNLGEAINLRSRILVKSNNASLQASE